MRNYAPLLAVVLGCCSTITPAQTVYRGFMTGVCSPPVGAPATDMNACIASNNATIAAVASWNANLIRWQFVTFDAGSWTRDQYRAWLQVQMDTLDASLPQCMLFGIKVVVDLHSPPGGVASSGPHRDEHRLFYEQRWENEFRRTWRILAQHYANNPAVWGFDILNEPHIDRTPEGRGAWRRIATLVARRIRHYDTDSKIVVEPIKGIYPIEMTPASERGAIRFRPIANVSGIVYGPHMYLPLDYTLQRVRLPSNGGAGCQVHYQDILSYPGVMSNGTNWALSTLQNKLLPVIQFQQAYGAQIFIGEFSAVRWAPGASQYLSDFLSICENHGWSAAYHAFREADVWDLEQPEGSVPPLPDFGQPCQSTAVPPSPTTTARGQVIQNWLALNP